MQAVEDEEDEAPLVGRAPRGRRAAPDGEV